ncbi:hypothetical protein [Microbacterium gubbeenense]|uniref:hypothetical protein n=1 Tax=Microbacterium gubbeenense TaxID=159896 RepID=UPI0003FAC2E4|nr:hypothetical protein [Microbacterium gubbeenense]
MTKTLLNDTQWLQELRADLLADGGAEVVAATPAWMRRPSSLRRVASELARSLPAHFDRIVAIGAGADTLGAAVSLATGVPFGNDADAVVPGEDVVVVAAEAADARAYQNGSVTVVGRSAVWANAPDTDALFTTPSGSPARQRKEST